jgi:hypothetical protein
LGLDLAVREDTTLFQAAAGRVKLRAVGQRVPG